MACSIDNRNIDEIYRHRHIAASKCRRNVNALIKERRAAKILSAVISEINIAEIRKRWYLPRHRDAMGNWNAGDHL